MRFSTVYGLIIPLVFSLLLVGMLNLFSAQADATLQICINNNCEMVSDYDGYHNKKKCINEDCSRDLPTNSSTDKVS
ncbi:MAG: hypothetical protein ACM3ZS_04945 [Nitrososphaerota archaeon]